YADQPMSNAMITAMMRQLFVFLLSLALIASGSTVWAQSNDQKAPEITNVEVSEVTEDTATITWETNEKADSLVNYGLQPNYGIVRIPVADRTTHSITLDNLDPGRVYY